MKNFKFILSKLPELLLTGVIVLYWIDTGGINPIAIVLLLVLGVQIIFEIKVMGIIISYLFIMFSLYMILALTSELREFTTFNTDAKHMLSVGLLYFGLSLSSAVFMIIKYLRRD